MLFSEMYVDKEVCLQHNPAFYTEGRGGEFQKSVLGALLIRMWLLSQMESPAEKLYSNNNVVNLWLNPFTNKVTEHFLLLCPSFDNNVLMQLLLYCDKDHPSYVDKHVLQLTINLIGQPDRFA